MHLFVLCRAAKILGEEQNAIVTGKHTQLINAITGAALPILKFIGLSLWKILCIYCVKHYSA